MLDVVIVGAGPAGIAAARSCRANGLTFTVLEASGTLGGRVRSVRTPDGGVFDLGAHWLHSVPQNPLAPFLLDRHAPEPLVDCIFGGNGALSEDDAEEAHAVLKAAMTKAKGIDRDGADCSVAEAVSGFAFGRWSSLFDSAFTNKQGVAPEQASAVDFARYVWVGDDIPVVTGMGAFIQTLAGELPVQVNSPVTMIDLSNRRFVRCSGEWGHLDAAAVIVTASTGVLASGLIRFSPQLPVATLAAIANLPMGSCNKVRLAFSRPVFGDVNPTLAIFSGHPALPVEMVIRENGCETVTALFHGSFGKDIASHGAAAMTDFALERLAQLFGAAVRRSCENNPLSVNWDEDVYVRGYVSSASPGNAQARADLATPVQDRLLFAGEATSPHFMGDVHGAWLEGERAVQKIRMLGFRR
jgi:monoamine oxidase